MNDLELDPSSQLFDPPNLELKRLFSPKSVALVGASERIGSVGRSTFENLLNGGFQGKIFPVNPVRKTILGKPCFSSLLQIPDEIDLLVVTAPAAQVPGIIREALQKKIPAAVVISAGFKENGKAGQKLEAEVLDLIRGKMRMIGPNCLGIMNPKLGLNATFAQGIAKPGRVAFLSQSGALCTAVLDWSLQENFGFSAFVSVGSMADVGWGDLIDYFGQDTDTHALVLYMESIGKAQEFLSAARETSWKKPIVLIKAGRTLAAAKAAASHTGSLTGSDAVLDAAFRRVGITRVDEIAEIFHLSDLLAKQPLPNGNRLTVLTNAGGPGVLVADALTLGGGQLAPLSKETIAELNQFLPESWSHGNPVDILGDAGAERYDQALATLMKDNNTDGLLAIMTPQGMTDPTAVARALEKHAKQMKKPLLASWMGGEHVAPAAATLAQSGIPQFEFPDEAARIFNRMWQHREHLNELLQVAHGAKEEIPNENRRAARDLILKIRNSGRLLLSELESKQVLQLYKIPCTPMEHAETPQNAAAAATRMGFPVVVKLHSLSITHKSDVGGVKLSLKTEAEVVKAFAEIQESVTRLKGSEHFGGVTIQPMIPRDGYELILGASQDPQMGPVLLFGMGGTLVEVFHDSSLALPPLNSTLARQMMERTKIFKALKGIRGQKPVDLNALDTLMVRLGELVTDLPEINEVDINPLLANSDRLLALDGRLVLGDPHLPVAQPVFRPYPGQYSEELSIHGKKLLFRLIKPEDEMMLGKFHESLSQNSIWLRYQQSLSLEQRTIHERLAKLCFADYSRQLPLVAFNEDQTEILGLIRLRRSPMTKMATLTMLVRDDWQKMGLGTALMQKILAIARTEGLEEIQAQTLAQNSAMQKLFKKFGFQLSDQKELIGAKLKLN